MAARRSPRAPMIPGSGPLSKVPPAAAFLVVIVLFAVGVLVKGGVGVVLLGAIGLGVTVLLATTWQALNPAERALRVVVLLVLVVVAISILRG